MSSYFWFPELLLFFPELLVCIYLKIYLRLAPVFSQVHATHKVFGPFLVHFFFC